MTTLRQARFADHWRTLSRRAYVTRYDRLEFNGIAGLADGILTFHPGITAIVGGNGVGKSTLAHAAAAALATQNGLISLQPYVGRLYGCSLKATVADATGVHEVGLSIDGSGGRNETGERETVAIQWVEPSLVAALVQRQVLGDANFADILEGVGARQLTASELASAAYVVGKDYTACEAYEIRDYGPFDVWPYFKVTCRGVTYGSERMGRGELSALVALWAIDVAPRNSIFVLEEPETHVSARSQSALMDILAWACASKSLWALVTTHSPAVLQRVPPQALRLLVGSNGGSVLADQPSLGDIAVIVGGGVAYKTLILVEDESALYFAKTIIERLDPDLHRQCAIQSMGGEGRIASIVKTLPKMVGDKWLQVVGCFDGDLQGKIDATQFNWPHVFLPGDRAPDSLLREAVAREEPIALATALQVRTESLAATLEAAAGLDVHDWTKHVADKCDRRPEELVRAMTARWLIANEHAAREFVAGIKSAFDRK